MFKPTSDNKKIIPYDVKAEQERQERARAQQQGEPTGIPSSILKERVSHVSSPTARINYSRNYTAGDRIQITKPDRNKWRRFLHWILMRDPPVITTYATISSVVSTNMEIP